MTKILIKISNFIEIIPLKIILLSHDIVCCYKNLAINKKRSIFIKMKWTGFGVMWAGKAGRYG
jgi:hypothetical protein